ncbi:hypothetical protein V6N13_113725 [Hibiscus sabdariffa]|uniref:Hexosyltransferase n=1 Tax=Hibiscus sabdariffa TaxID=183260 RepID=A0ABR2TZR1_9ROSI
MKPSSRSSEKKRFILSSLVFLLFFFLCVLVSINEFRFGRCAFFNLDPFYNSTSRISLEPDSTSDDLRILIGILTLPDQYHRCHFLRLVYGTQSTMGALVDVKFVFCNLTKEDQKVMVALEIMRYDDIIIRLQREHERGQDLHILF